VQRRKVGLWVIFTAIGVVLYRLGGKAGWNTKFRDIGVSACFCALLWLQGGISGLWQTLSLVPTFGLLFAALTTYRYFLPKPKDYKWYHYALHGFFTAFSAVFYAWASGCWLGFWIRCGLNAVLVAVVSHFISKDWLEEGLRGASIVGSVPLLLR
jgi:hypothetical protein